MKVYALFFRESAPPRRHPRNARYVRVRRELLRAIDPALSGLRAERTSPAVARRRGVPVGGARDRRFPRPIHRQARAAFRRQAGIRLTASLLAERAARRGRPARKTAKRSGHRERTPAPDRPAPKANSRTAGRVARAGPGANPLRPNARLPTLLPSGSARSRYGPVRQEPHTTATEAQVPDKPVARQRALVSAHQSPDHHVTVLPLCKWEWGWPEIRAETPAKDEQPQPSPRQVEPPTYSAKEPYLISAPLR
jgi:hypothetical protein